MGMGMDMGMGMALIIWIKKKKEIKNGYFRSRTGEKSKATD